MLSMSGIKYKINVIIIADLERIKTELLEISDCEAAVNDKELRISMNRAAYFIEDVVSQLMQATMLPIMKNSDG